MTVAGGGRSSDSGYSGNDGGYSKDDGGGGYWPELAARVAETVAGPCDGTKSAIVRTTPTTTTSAKITAA